MNFLRGFVGPLLLTALTITTNPDLISAWILIEPPLSRPPPRHGHKCHEHSWGCSKLDTTKWSRVTTILYGDGKGDNDDKGDESSSSVKDNLMDLESGEIYSNPLTAFLGNFLPSGGSSTGNPEESDTEETVDLGPFIDDWNKPKRLGLTTKDMVSILDQGLKERQWFVTGNAMPELFSGDFYFKDPDVQLRGIQKYCEGVRRLFDQESSRADIIDVFYNKELSEQSDENSEVITVEWRLSGKVNIGPFGGLKIKPYICYSDLYRSKNNGGLIYFQEDRFNIPSWDLLLSFFVPWLPFLAPPAPEIDEILEQRKKEQLVQ